MKLTRSNVFLIILCLLPLIPLWYFPYLPLQDYPNHFARLLIIKAYAYSDFYQTHFQIIPFNPLSPFSYTYLSLDVFVTKVVGFLDTDSAMRLFLTLYVVTFLGALFLASKILKQDFSMILLLYIPLIYSAFFYQGLLNFIFSIPFFILAVLALEGSQEMKSIRNLSFLFLALSITFLSHSFTFLVFWIYFLIYLVVNRTRMKSFLLLFVPTSCVLGLGIFLFLREYDFLYESDFFITKVLFLTFPFIHFTKSIYIAISVLYLSALYLLLSKAKISRKHVLCSSLILFIIFLVIPTRASVGYVDARFLFFAYILLPFSFTLSPGRRVRLSMPILTGISIAGFIYLSVVSTQFNQNFSTRCQSAVNEQSMVFPIDAVRFEVPPFQPYRHAWGYYFIYKELFSPYLFRDPHINLKYKIAPRVPPGLWFYMNDIDSFTNRKQDIMNTYDYILVMDEDSGVNEMLSGSVDEICSDKSVHLYQIRKPP